MSTEHPLSVTHDRSTLMMSKEYWSMISLWLQTKEHILRIRNISWKHDFIPCGIMGTTYCMYTLCIYTSTNVWWNIQKESYCYTL